MLEKLSSHRYVVEKGSIVESSACQNRELFGSSQPKLSKVDQQSSALNHDLVSVQLFPPAPAKLCPFQQLMLSYMGP